ncbi:MAG: hypothetical protein NT175_00515 [Bacteroidetes bacterium]|nr:hypothetical protein [Bacteroidota bacterium]
MQKGFGIHIPEKREKKDWRQICREHLSYDPELCPHCKRGKMITIERFDPGRGPPFNLYNRQAVTGK